MNTDVTEQSVLAEGHSPAFSSPRGAAQATSPCELTVVVPTFNERANVERLLARLEVVLAGVSWQAIFVDDDSPDGTASLVKEIAARDPRVQCLRRVGRRGLAGAVTEGAMASAAPFVAVIDGDMQHDESVLPRMLQALRGGDYDVVIGSRYLNDDGLAKGLSPFRKLGSQAATWLGRRALGVEITDPVSGFFMIRREAYEAVAPRLAPEGFKILFDILASQKTPLRVLELPYAFREREAGESKLDGRVVLEYFGLVAAKLTGDLISPRALMFALVGASGVAVNLGMVPVFQRFGAPFWLADTLAAITAMTSNFFINNVLTYRDRRLKGWRLLSGYVRFCLMCSIGLGSNVAVATVLKIYGAPWWAATILGAGAAAVWNYVSTSLAVW